MYARSMTDYKRLAGIGSAHTDWVAVSPLVEAETKKAAPLPTLQRTRIRRMANLLDEERMGGSLNDAQFDPDFIERLMEAAASDPRAHAAAQHHAHALALHKHASMLGKSGNSDAAHKAHMAAAEQHRNAAKHLGALGAVKSAHVHDILARHHEAHAAAHARQLGGINHTHDQPAAAPKKAGLLGRLKAKISGVGGGGINWAAKAAETGAPVKAHVQADPFKKKPMMKKKASGMHVAKDPFGPEHEKHSAMAHRATAGAVQVGQSHDVSSQRKAHAFKNASHEHLHAALSAFHSGNHEKALTHFNAAIHHMNKHQAHMSDAAAQKRQKSRTAAGGGPRAAVGRAHV